MNEWSEDMVQEQAYLISRQVRPLAIVGFMSSDEKEMDHAFYYLKKTAGPDNVIPFVLPQNDTDNVATAGYASEQWVIDLLKWLYRDAPPRQFHQILGLLLGYSPKCIAEHDLGEFAGCPKKLSTPTPRSDDMSCKDQNGLLR